ncbi:poly(3-hydroxyalkanoate) polymerase 1 [Luminiphilus syltensis NOR5-1B]|uniref:Poly(3-hydroxyalkanoate) polymerase 1 n=1 Tax=Luminiphilus syltensis NOR5-1B TaxID=565045 RepID=B8KX71_9GAMM|nr:alpha/beta fold hydrolase [Luminiphilus syltensis]EED34844.1 poly(3-hydroxyalkanoate) polymerase 1 [Luminiphilus syltensis NOR5-1B]
MARKKVSKPKASKLPRKNREGSFEPMDFARSLVSNLSPAVLGREGKDLLTETGRILSGSSELDFGKDPRFKDPAWRENPMYKRIGQFYLAMCKATEQIAEQAKHDPMQYEKAKLAVDHINSLLSPTNNILTNPAAIKRGIDTGGRSLVDGMRNFLHDARNNNALPSQADGTDFVVGKNLAVTPGAVVYRNEQLEIIQYAPTTKEVFKIPVLVMTPQVNKFYFLDLSPGRSFVEYMTSQGYQVFIVSWKNPSPAQGHWNLDTYCEALLGAVDAVRQITASKTINTFGFCAGGITMSALLSSMIYKGQGHKINTVSYAVTLIDFSEPAMIGILKSDFLLDSAQKTSQGKGVLEGDKLAAVFTLLRPNDLIWNYWVNNYLMGKSPPPFDILVWNSDGTNLPASLHKDFLTFFDDNAAAKPGAFEVLGTPMDIGTIEQDAFVVGAVNDHLTPWIGCYKTTQMLGGKSEFVLSSSGHIAGLVNPPGNPKSFYLTGSEPGPDPHAWKAEATSNPGSWWEYWVVWASTRSGDKKRARKTLGSKKFPPLTDAPGKYVRE